MVYCQFASKQRSSKKFYLEFRSLDSRKCILKCRLQKGSHLVSASVCLKLYKVNMNAWRFHQWHGYVARMTVPANTGGAEGKLQRPQWQPVQPPRRRIRFCYCTIIMTIEWHNTRFSHADWHIYASMNYINIDLDNGLSPEQRQAIIQSRAETSITFQNINFHLAIYIRKCHLLRNTGYFASESMR